MILTLERFDHTPYTSVIRVVSKYAQRNTICVKRLTFAVVCECYTSHARLSNILNSSEFSFSLFCIHYSNFIKNSNLLNLR